jgi:hypothetical protein
MFQSNEQFVDALWWHFASFNDTHQNFDHSLCVKIQKISKKIVRRDCFDPKRTKGVIWEVADIFRNDDLSFGHHGGGQDVSILACIRHGWDQCFIILD